MDNPVYTSKGTGTSGRTLFVLFLLISLGNYYFDLGFALKFYMVFCIGFIVFQLSAFYFQKLQLFEIFMFVFYLFYLYSGAFSLYPDSSLRITLGVFLYLSCYIIIKGIIKDTNPSVIEKALGAAGILFNFLSLILYIAGLKSRNFVLTGDGGTAFGVMFDRDYPRLIGVLHDPNFFIFYNTLFFTYFLCNLKSSWNKVGLLLCIVTSFLTFSRGGLLAMLIVFLIFFFMNKPKIQAKILAGLTISLSGITYITTVHFNFNFFDILESRVEDLSSDGGSGRFELWLRALDFFSSNMFFGVGAFNYQDYNYHFYGDNLYTHNTFFEILSESGLIGMSFFCIFITTLIVQNFKSNLFRKKPFLFLTLIGFLLQMFSLSIVVNDMFFLYLAILSAYLTFEQNNKSSAESTMTDELKNFQAETTKRAGYIYKSKEVMER